MVVFILKDTLLEFFWSLPYLSPQHKEKLFFTILRILGKQKYHYIIKDETTYRRYCQQILSLFDIRDAGDFVTENELVFIRKKSDPKLIAYYLPQFYPFKENDNWWGKGTTEWNNVSKAVPQFLGHYQPRLPGELGYYDLRIKENILRQIQLAKVYGIYAFCYYYYWFDGKRLLDRPLDLFLESKEMSFPFCLCWANEDWTRNFSGSSGEVIVKQSKSVESYKNFILGLGKYLVDDRYLTIGKKKVLIVYKPSHIPRTLDVLEYWREYLYDTLHMDLYLIAVKASQDNTDYLKAGFDAVTEFQPTSDISKRNMQINEDMEFVVPEFYGIVYDYQKIVKNQIYLKHQSSKLYRAVMPMWDNTARRNNKGAIFHGSTPELYEKWLLDTIKSTKERKDLEDQLVFINAWNEWGEGAYLEPDRRYGYAYLQATRNAIEKSRTFKNL